MSKENFQKIAPPANIAIACEGLKTDKILYFNATIFKKWG